MKNSRASDWLKMSAFSCYTSGASYNSAHTFKMSSVLTFCAVVSCTLLRSNNKIPLALWCNKQLQIFQRLQIALVLPDRAILLSLKNLLMLINTDCTRNHVVTYTNNKAMTIAKAMAMAMSETVTVTVTRTIMMIMTMMLKNF